MTLCPNYDVVWCTKRDPPKDEKRIHNSIKSTVNASRSSFLSMFKNIVLHLKILFQWLRFCQISHIFNLHVNFPIDRKLDKSIRSNDILPHVYLIKMSVSKKSVASCLSCRLVTYLIGIFNDYIYQIAYERCNPRDKHRGQREWYYNAL